MRPVRGRINRGAAGGRAAAVVDDPVVVAAVAVRAAAVVAAGPAGKDAGAAAEAATAKVFFIFYPHDPGVAGRLTGGEKGIRCKSVTLGQRCKQGLIRMLPLS